MNNEAAAPVSGNPNVYYVGSFRFPDGDAAAARVLGIGKALRAAGARVIFGGWEKGSRPQDIQPDGSFQFGGFHYISQADIRHTHLSHARRLAGAVLAGRNTLHWLAQQSVQPGDVVIAYHGGTYFLSRIHRWCRFKGLRLVVDCTEWYSPEQLPGGRLSPAWWDSEIRMRRINPSVGRLMVISSYLERYYKAKGCSVLLVPPLLDLQETRWNAADPRAPASPPLRLAYAGTPGRKDLIVNILRGLVALREQNMAIILNLIGPTRESLMQTVPESTRWLDLLEDSVLFHGRVPQSDVPRRLMESHFTVLLRPCERYAQAGFPTKIVESLGAGVPVIVNPTSDIDRYIEDGREGILLANESLEAFATGVRRVLSLGAAAWSNMRMAARQRADASFDYRNYIEPLRRFVLRPEHDAPQSA